jgi:hypothetical protein
MCAKILRAVGWRSTLKHRVRQVNGLSCITYLSRLESWPDDEYV